MDWNQIRTFVTVAETGSLSSASEKLRASQPTLGRQIGALERAVGESLFVRSRTGMQLTEAGLALIDEAREMARRADLFALKATGQDNTISGTVRITASDVVATFLLPPILAGLQNEYPQIQIELVPSNTVENLLARDADVAIRMVRPTQNELIARKVNEMAMGAFAHRDYLDRHGRPQIVSDLFQHRIIGYDRNDLIIRTMKEMGIKGGPETFALRTDDQVAYWYLVLAGAGIGFGVRSIARQSNELERLLPTLQIPPLPMWLTAHAEVRTNRRIRQVVDYLGDAISALPLSE